MLVDITSNPEDYAQYIGKAVRLPSMRVIGTLESIEVENGVFGDNVWLILDTGERIFNGKIKAALGDIILRCR